MRLLLKVTQYGPPVRIDLARVHVLSHESGGAASDIALVLLGPCNLADRQVTSGYTARPTTSCAPAACSSQNATHGAGRSAPLLAHVGAALCRSAEADVPSQAHDVRLRLRLRRTVRNRMDSEKVWARYVDVVGL